MKKTGLLITLILCCLTCFCLCEKNTEPEKAYNLFNDFRQKYGEDKFTWPPEAFVELGHSLREIDGIFDCEDEKLVAFACQLYTIPENETNFRELVVEYSKALLSKYFREEPLNMTANYILDFIGADNQGRWIVSFRTSRGIRTFEFTKQAQFKGVRCYSLNEEDFWPFIAGNTFSRWEQFRIMWRTNDAPLNYWLAIEQWCRTCIDMNEMLSTWNARQNESDGNSFLQQAISFYSMSCEYPATSTPILMGIPGENDLTREEVATIVQKEIKTRLSYEPKGVISYKMSFWYNAIEDGSRSWEVVVFCNDREVATIMLDEEGNVLSFDEGAGKG